MSLKVRSTLLKGIATISASSISSTSSSPFSVTKEPPVAKRMEDKKYVDPQIARMAQDNVKRIPHPAHSKV
jgi:hypothetical protein